VLNGITLQKDLQKLMLVYHVCLPVAIPPKQALQLLPLDSCLGVRNWVLTSATLEACRINNTHGVMLHACSLMAGLAYERYSYK
jgi:hypothetical protein